MSLRIEHGELALALHDKVGFQLREYHIKSLSDQSLSATEIQSSLLPFADFGRAASVSCSFNLPGNTFIPRSIYQEEFHEDYLAFNLNHIQAGSSQADHIPLTDAVNVYALPEAHLAIGRQYPQCLFFHEATLESELALRLSKLNRTDGVFLFFSGNFFRIHVIRGGKLELSNTFEYTSEMDVAYYVLYVFDQLQIKSVTNPVFAAGKIENDGAVINLLREYIGPVKLLETCALADLKIHEEKPGDARQLFTLFHQLLCV